MREKRDGNRVLAKISHGFVHGIDELNDPQKSITICNFSMYDIEVRIYRDDELVKNVIIYPYVCDSYHRLEDNEKMELDGTYSEYKITLTRSDFKRKMNFFVGKNPDELTDMHLRYKIWLKNVADRSDIFRPSGDSFTVDRKTNDETEISPYPIVVVLFSLIVVLICLIFYNHYINNAINKLSKGSAMD